MLSYHYLFDIALILISTKLLGLLTRRFKMPQVVGALLAGLILGPALLNVLKETEFIKQVAELGVIVLMFTAGLETDIKELKKAGKASLIIAICGVILPLIGGFGIAFLFTKDAMQTGNVSIMLQNIFIGIILTATSVSITVETLKEMGKLSTRAGNAILGAALIDDILGIIALTVITSLADSTVNILWVIAKILLFFVASGVIGFIFYKLFNIWVNRHNRGLQRFAIIAFVFCLGMSFCAEYFFGVADITGAFLAGLIISNTQKTKYIASRFEVISYMLLSPIFFASIGIQVSLPAMTPTIILFAAALLVIAVVTKILGCGIGAKLCKYTNKESVQIGVGMISRGEVALIVATKGAAVGLMSTAFFGPIVIVVVITTIVTPILLKLAFKSKQGDQYDGLIQSDLVENYEETAELELAEQDMLNLDQQMKAVKPKADIKEETDPLKIYQ